MLSKVRVPPTTLILAALYKLIQESSMSSMIGVPKSKIVLSTCASKLRICACRIDPSAVGVQVGDDFCRDSRMNRKKPNTVPRSMGRFKQRVEER